MQPIQINVSVNIGVNQELYGLLSSLLSRPQEVVETAAPAPRKPRAAKQQPVVENQPAPEPVQTEKPEPQPETTATEIPAEQAPAEEPEQTAKEYTEVDVREAMDRTRKRIEGENYKEQTDSELYKKWHRRLTAFFKSTAAVFGSDKPSTLPDSESRAKFISCCDAVYVKDDELVENCPF